VVASLVMRFCKPEEPPVFALTDLISTKRN
jgi:hypothetical protein